MEEKKEMKHNFYLWLDIIENYVEITKETLKNEYLLRDIKRSGYELIETDIKVYKVGNFTNHYYELIKNE